MPCLLKYFFLMKDGVLITPTIGYAMKSNPPLIGLPTRPPIPFAIPKQPPRNPLALAPAYGS
jgi:hypothetical protein